MLGEQGGEVICLQDLTAFALFDGKRLFIFRPTIPFSDALGGEGVDGRDADLALRRKRLQHAEDVEVRFIEDAHHAAVTRVGVDGGDDVSDVFTLVEETDGFSEREGADCVEGVVLEPLGEVDGMVLVSECGEF